MLRRTQHDNSLVNYYRKCLNVTETLKSLYRKSKFFELHKISQKVPLFFKGNFFEDGYCDMSKFEQILLFMTLNTLIYLSSLTHSVGLQK